MMIAKIVFVSLLCVPIVALWFSLFEKLLDQYIRAGKRDQENPDEQERITKYRHRKRKERV